MDEIIKLEKKIAFYFKNTRKDTFMTEEDEKHYRSKHIFRFCEKKIKSSEKSGHCQLTGKYRGPAHSICNINVTEKQSNLIQFVFHKFFNYDCHLFFRKLVDKKNDSVKFDITPKKNEEFISVTFGYSKFIDNSRLLSSSLDSLVKTLGDNSDERLKISKKEIVGNDGTLNIVNKIGEEHRTIEDSKED